MPIRMILPLLIFLWPFNEAIAEQSHLVTMPIWESSQLTCSWWSANKGNAARDKADAIAAAFMEGYNAGRSGTTDLKFSAAGSGTGFMLIASAFAATWTPMQIDDFCKEYPQEAWTRALMVIYQKSLEPPPPPPAPPGMKRQMYDKDLKKWKDVD